MHLPTFSADCVRPASAPKVLDPKPLKFMSSDSLMESDDDDMKVEFQFPPLKSSFIDLDQSFEGDADFEESVEINQNQERPFQNFNLNHRKDMTATKKPLTVSKYEATNTSSSDECEDGESSNNFRNSSLCSDSRSKSLSSSGLEAAVSPVHVVLANGEEETEAGLQEDMKDKVKASLLLSSARPEKDEADTPPELTGHTEGEGEEEEKVEKEKEELEKKKEVGEVVDGEGYSENGRISTISSGITKSENCVSGNGYISAKDRFESMLTSKQNAEDENLFQDPLQQMEGLFKDEDHVEDADQGLLVLCISKSCFKLFSKPSSDGIERIVLIIMEAI